MSKVKWTDYDSRYLESVLTQYQEVVSLSSEKMTKIITTFRLILSHADFLISMSSELQDRRMILEGYEVWRLALDIITQASSIRDLIEKAQLETQGGLTRVKEIMDAVAGARSSSPADLEHLVQEVAGLREVMQQIRTQAEDLLPAITAILEQAKVLQERVGELSASSGHHDHPTSLDKTEWQRFRGDPYAGNELNRGTNLDSLMFPTPQKIREN